MPEAYWGESEKEGLVFFGKMSACISHEIKNHLAIINEQTGLVGDLLLMAERGRSLDTERLKELAQDISRQVNRADRVVKSLNRLAHSVDEPHCLLDLNETVGLLVSISTRIASVKGLHLEMDSSTSPVQVESSPFFLMCIVFFYLDTSMSASSEGQLTVSVKDIGDVGQITISGSFEDRVRSPEAMPAPIRVLQEKLSLTVDLDGPLGAVVIRVPKVFERNNSSSKTKSADQETKAS